MPDIPSIFNRSDFIAILLPGYVVIISYLIVFQSTILFAKDQLEFDIVSAVIFVVAGPAVGMTIRQFHRGLRAIYSKLRYREIDEDFLKKYAFVCSKMSEEDKRTLEETEATYDFSVSTGLSFCILAIYVVMKLGFSTLEPVVIFVVGGILLLLTGYLQLTDSYSPLMKCLIAEYNESEPKHCPFTR